MHPRTLQRRAARRGDHLRSHQGRGPTRSSPTVPVPARPSAHPDHRAARLQRAVGLRPELSPLVRHDAPTGARPSLSRFPRNVSHVTDGHEPRSRIVKGTCLRCERRPRYGGAVRVPGPANWGTRDERTRVVLRIQWREHRLCESSNLVTTVDPMASPILLCTDGSNEAMVALSAGLDLVGRDHELVLVTVMNAPDEASLAGSGHAGPDLTLEEYDDKIGQARDTASSTIIEARGQLALAGAEVRTLEGDPGAAICQLAAELSASAIIVGSRGRGGLKRMFLGSVSDYVVRNAPCSVVVTRA